MGTVFDGSPLQMAIRNSEECIDLNEVIEGLIAMGCDINGTDSADAERCALSVACRSGNCNAAMLLIRRGIDCTAVDKVSCVNWT